MALNRSKIICALIALCCVFGNIGLQAQQARKKVGLVLGGGGAKGAAEVGVLKVLEEADIPVDYVVGTSIGGIVGALYSIGYNAADLDSLLRNQDWVFLLSDQVKRESETFLSKDEKDKYLLNLPLTKERKVSLPSGYVNGLNILNLFSKLTVGYHHVDDFSSLPIPFRCVAVDLVEGKEVVLSSGSLPMAMRATMSIPGVFAPIEWNGMMLVDGGALNNLPVDVVREMGADIVICVDLSTGWKKKDDLKSAASVVDQLIGIMGQPKYRKNKAEADIYINPPLKGYTPASFQAEAIDSMVQRGERAARMQWDKLTALRREIYGSEADSASHRVKPHRQSHTEAYQIADIRIEGVEGEEKEWIRKKIALQEHSSLNPEDIDRTLAKLQGLNIFSRVEYRLTNDEPYDLVFMLEPRENRRLNIGARFDTEELASVIANISNNQQFATNHHYALTGRLSSNPYLDISYAYGHLFGSKIGFSYRLAHHDFDLYQGKQKLDALELTSHSLAGFYTCDLGNFRLKAGTQLEFFHYHSDLHGVDGSSLKRSSDHFLNYFVSFAMDTYDRSYFPSRGGRIQLQGKLHTDDGLSYDDGKPFGDVALHAECALRCSPRFYIIPKLKARALLGNTIPAIYQNYVGGISDAYYLPWQMAWESSQHTHLLERNVAAAQLSLRYRLKKKFYVTALGEYGKQSRKISRILSGDNLWGCALRASFDFVFGPISLQTNYSNLDKNVGVYINAGFLF